MMCQHGAKNIIFISRELLAPGCAPVAAQFQQTCFGCFGRRRPSTQLVMMPNAAAQKKWSREVWSVLREESTPVTHT